MGIFTKAKNFLLPSSDYFRLKMLTPFSQFDLDGMKEVEQKAIYESRKSVATGLANADDIIELTIQNKSVKITKATQNPLSKDRQRLVLRFSKIVVAKYPRQINLVMNIGLHDTYLNDLGIFSFSISDKSSLNILIADLYATQKYSGRLGSVDKVDFIHKKHEAIFIGSTTGSFDPMQNDRLQLCNYFLNNERVKCYINNICQMPESAIDTVFPVYKNFIHSTMSIATQLENKFIITVDGNTAAWDRLVWILNSNSVCLKKKSDHKCWYYDFLENGKHYIEFEEFDQIEKIMDTITTEQCIEIIKNANAFVKEFLTYDKHLAYMGHLLYYSSINGNQNSDVRNHETVR